MELKLDPMIGKPDCPICEGTGYKTVLNVGEYDEQVIELRCNCASKENQNDRA